MCPRHVFAFDNANMDLELYRRIIQDCKDYVEFVWPYGIGEPLLHPGIFEMIRLTREEGVRTGLSTNATLLDESRSQQLLDSGLDYVILAFDGATAQTYERYRAGADFSATQENILAFLKMKTARKSRMHVIVQMVVLRDNAAEIDDFRRLWAVGGVDEVRFKRDETRIDGSALAGEEISASRRNPCHLLWRGPLYIRHDGQVLPCCYMYKESPIGDVRRQTLREIWNSPAMVRLREAHLRRELTEFPTCEACQAPRPSLGIVYGSLAVNSFAVRKAVPALEKLARFYGIGIFEKRS